MRNLKLCILLLGIICMATACGSEKPNDGSGASQIAEDDATGNYKLEEIDTITSDELMKQSKEICDAFNNEEITYDEAKEYLETAMEGLPEGEKRNIISEAINQLDLLNVSKSAYEAGVQNMDKEDINYKVDAITQFKKVIEEDTNYETAQSYLETLTKEYYEHMVASADGRITEGYYPAAIQIYDDMIDLIGDYNGLEEQRDNIVYEYIETSIAEAESYMAENKFTEAKNCIDKCIDNVGSNTALETEQERIEDFTPVSLMELDSLYEDSESSDIYIKEWESDDSTNLGENGFTGIKILNYGAMNKKVTISYIINGEYDTFTAQFVLHENSKNKTDSEYYGAFLGIYGDDVQLYKSEQLYGGVLPIDVSVDISGVNKLDIIFFSGCKFDFSMSNSFEFGLINPELKNVYVPLDTTNGNTENQNIMMKSK